MTGRFCMGEHLFFLCCSLRGLACIAIDVYRPLLWLDRTARQVFWNSRWCGRSFSFVQIYVQTIFLSTFSRSVALGLMEAIFCSALASMEVLVLAALFAAQFMQVCGAVAPCIDVLPDAPTPMACRIPMSLDFCSS